MPNLSIKDVPEAWAEALRQRAARHHRSLQGELMALIEQAVQASNEAGAILHQGSGSFDQWLAERRAQGPRPVIDQSSSTRIVRASRDRTQ